MSIRDDWPKGQNFKVVASGVVARGMRPAGSSVWTFSRVELPVGTVIKCDGFGPGFGSDPGYGIHWEISGLTKAEVTPRQGGLFDFRPADGLLVRTNKPVTKEFAL